MGQSQTSFLSVFRETFQARTGQTVLWTGGQTLLNTAALPINAGLRRRGRAKAGERFELGDLTAQVGNWRVVVEFETGAVPLSNLLKYWPYIRGELSTKPEQPLLICHFSDWWSYATRRDLWEWTLSRMKADPEKIVQVEGRQFDHWASDTAHRDASLTDAIDWVMAVAAESPGAA